MKKAISYLRGHAIYFNDQWRYVDNDEPTITHWESRSCGACSLPNRPDGHDACLGELPGVINACCGHGQETQAYVQFANKDIVRGSAAIHHFISEEE